MCGVIILGGKRFEIPCEISISVRDWRPPIDFTQIAFPRDPVVGGPMPDPWKQELTLLGTVLALAPSIRDKELGAMLGKVAVDVANRIAKTARTDVSFEWDDHRARSKA